MAERRQAKKLEVYEKVGSTNDFDGRDRKVKLEFHLLQDHL
jgi:hypothetical protein